MFSGTAMLVKIPSKSQCVSIIENDHIRLSTKEPVLYSHRIKRARKWEPQVREKLRGRDAILSCSVTVLNKKTFVVVQEIIICWLNASVLLSLQMRVVLII